MKQRGNNPTYLVLIIDKDLSAFVSQESVRPSISALNCSHASLLAGPRSPETPKYKVQSGVNTVSVIQNLASLLFTINSFYFGCVVSKEVQASINIDSSFRS